MDGIENITSQPNVAAEILRSTLQQSQELAEQLIKVNVENLIDLGQLEYMGTVIDTFV